VSEPALWELRGVSKAFPGVQALADVSLAVRPGEMHALVGENGSGKTTLVKVLAGVHRPDTGEVLLRGAPVALPNPTAARRAGVATIFQEFSLVSSLTVAENVFLGRLPLRPGTRAVDWDAMRRRAADELAALGLHLDPDARVGALSVAQQQEVEIAKAISADSNLLIMDEPTAALSPHEVERLHGLVRRLAAAGRAVLYVSHRLHEFLGMVDTVTVLRDGRVVATKPAAGLDLDDVVRLMIGTELKRYFVKERHATATPLLEVEGLRTEAVRGVDLTVHRGEVLGLAGMTGSGRSEIARALLGVDRPVAGEVRLDGRRVEVTSPRRSIAAGIGLVPEHRAAEGLFLNFPGPPNVTVSDLGRLRRGPFLSLRRERRVAREHFERLRVTPAAVTRSVRFLSGGNQQKLVIARWLHAGSRLLLLDEPTQGIDVAAKVEVYRIMNELTAQGIAILLISSDYQELLAMSDRLAIVRDRRVDAVVPAGELDEYALLRAVAREVA
jgi:ABC-type sugar transport system ATPase subunit